LREFEARLPELPITEEVWKRAYIMAQKTKSLGDAAPSPDILIAACAQFHEVGLEHSDSDFNRLNPPGEI
jgi:predicted nucleic acid-binding protein